MPLGIAHTYADYQVKWAMAFLQDEAVQLVCVPAITRGVEVDEAKQASQHLELGLCKKPDSRTCTSRGPFTCIVHPTTATN